MKFPRRSIERHAARHWLTLQAMAAVARALRDPDTKMAEMFERELEAIDEAGAETDAVRLAYLGSQRDVAIADAAALLVRSELLHREIVQRGGTVRR